MINCDYSNLKYLSHTSLLLQYSTCMNSIMQMWTAVEGNSIAPWSV